MDFLRILHIEDSERDYELILRLLENAGKNVHSLRVETAEEMDEALKGQTWDVILADCNLPRFDSFRALEVLQHHGEDIPLILVSGTVGEETAVKLMKAGAVDYIMKDNLARLVPAISREVTDAEHRRARHAAEARLRDRERMLSAAQQVAHLGSWEFYLPDGPVTWSQELSTIVGGAPPDGAGDLRFFINAVHPYDREEVEQAIEVATSSGDMVEIEHRAIRLDGSERWILLQVGSEKDEEGYPTRLVGTILDITERKQVDQALRESERKYRLLLEQAADGIVVINSLGRIELANTRICEMLGYQPDEFIGQRMENILDPEDLAERPLRIGQLRAGVTLRNERALRHKDGHFVSTETSSKALDDGNVQIIIRDVTDRREAEASLRRSEQEYRNLFDRANDAILIVDPQQMTVLDANPRACELYAVPHEEIVDLPLHDLAERVGDGMSAQASELLAWEGQGYEMVLRSKDGTPLHLMVSSSPVDFRGRPCILSIQRDISAQKRLEDQLRHQALHDGLTGLANRALLQDRLEHALLRARQDHEDVAVLMLDLDRFKLINDSLGHEVGDQLLRLASARLLECVRDGDTVARFSGDEFAILVEGVTNMREVTMLAERVSNSLHLPFELESLEVVLTVSMGIVISGQGFGTIEELLSNAELAMYRAKDSGRGSYIIFDPSMNATMLERLKLETALRQAIPRDELHVYYQPIVELSSTNITGMEALVRWMHPERGLLAPGEFIPLAEETGLIRLLDQYVFTTACRQLAAWQKSYPEQNTITLSVNLSAQGFGHPDLVHDISTVLRETVVDPECIQIELTESVIMTDAAAASARLHQLKQLGVRVAIDDFGTGYSSLSYLKRFPVDVLKVDKTFVDELGADLEDTAIVGAIVSLGQALGLKIVAEGIETANAVNVLLELGCLLGQGYYYSRPLPAEALESIWANGLRFGRNWDNLQAS